MTSAQVRVEFAELCPPTVKFSKALRPFPTLYARVRHWLNASGANLTQHPLRGVLITLATNVYIDNEEVVAATWIVRNI